MSREEAIAKLKEQDSDTICKYCIYENDCNKGVTNAGGEPIFPPCCDIDCDIELENLIDIDAYIADIIEEGEDE